MLEEADIDEGTTDILITYPNGFGSRKYVLGITCIMSSTQFLVKEVHGRQNQL